MAKYIVYMTATASIAHEIEADSADEAGEEAYWQEQPYFPGGMEGDLGDWEVERVEEVEDAD